MLCNLDNVPQLVYQFLENIPFSARVALFLLSLGVTDKLAQLF